MNALYIAACLLLGVALLAETVAKCRYSKPVQTIATSLTDAPRTPTDAIQDADVHRIAGDRASLIGLIAAGSGVLLWMVSRLQGDRSTAVLPIAFAVAYALLWLLMV